MILPMQVMTVFRVFFFLFKKSIIFSKFRKSRSNIAPVLYKVWICYDRQNTNFLQIVPCLEVKLQTSCTIMSPNTRIISKHYYSITEFHSCISRITVGYTHTRIRAEHEISKLVLGMGGHPWFVIAISKMEMTLVMYGFKRSLSTQ